MSFVSASAAAPVARKMRCRLPESKTQAPATASPVTAPPRDQTEFSTSARSTLITLSPFHLHRVVNPSLSFATAALAPTPAPTGLRNIAQGQPSLSEATLGCRIQIRKQTGHPATPSIHQQRPPYAPPHACRPAQALLPASPFPSHRVANPSVPFAHHTALAPAPALKGLRNTAQGQPSLSEATLGCCIQIRKQTEHPATPSIHQQRPPYAPPHACRPARPSRTMPALHLAA